MDKLAFKCRKKFVRYFPGGFGDETYVDWERGYKWAAHEKWQDELAAAELTRLIRDGHHLEAAARAVRIESRTNLLFSFEKMALRDAVKSAAGAETFATGLLAFLHGRGSDQRRFEDWCRVIESLPRKQTRVLTWPVTTVFGFIAQPERHIFLKPNVTRIAARAYGFDFEYVARPSWPTYRSLLDFGERICRDQRELKPRDLIDAQGFIWVQGSDEY